MGHLENLRRQMLDENEHDELRAATALARKLHLAIGYSQGSATLAAIELFPEITEAQITDVLGWEFP